ncbi:MAG: NAD(P)/FAD-dependent oxidoreductase [Armatimonadota bacterium]
MPRFPFVVVVGAGPAGLMAAGRASEVGASVALLERNHRLALKLRISGKGRCNLTNTASTERFIEAFAPNGQFLYGPLSRFSPEDLRALLACLGVPTVEERGGRVFPASGRASDVADALEQWARRNGARVLRGCSARALVIRECAVAGVKTDDGNTLEADAVVVATGGLSYPRTGSTGDGYRLARQAGHTIVPCRPALVPLETVEDWPKSLQGVSLRNVAATLLVDGHRQASEFGEMLFTHFGMSGPIILTLSRTVVPLLEKGKVEVSIDLKPALSPEKLEARFMREFRSKRALRSYLPELSVRALGPVLAEHSGIPEGQPLNTITAVQRRKLVAVVKDLRATVARARPIEEAIVTAGGVCLKEVDPRSMQSKLVRGLYFAGEVLDLDAVTGGFNLQAAFTTGWVAGDSAGRGAGVD